MEISIWWMRRDLRTEDNAALFHALQSGHPVLPVFIFDSEITDTLEHGDRRLEFIYSTISELKARFESLGSSLLVRHGKPVQVFTEILATWQVNAVYASVDYEPYSISRDKEVSALCRERGSAFHAFHDHVVFPPAAVMKSDGSPYHVFTPYSRSWLGLFRTSPPQELPSQLLLNGLLRLDATVMPVPAMLNITGACSGIPPRMVDEELISNYHLTRDFPGSDGTSRLGIHLRFGTIPVRGLAILAARVNPVFLNELIWREFYQMILYQHPEVVTRSFKSGYDGLKWLNREEDFSAWCEGRTGYPLVDAGMRELTSTGFMHNRVRMVTASFLTKHLLVDWRWGEAFFARHLLDYELASNNGGWQWAAGSGCDAAPYFRVFNPSLQQQRFDPKNTYVDRWVPEWSVPGKYVKPIVEHVFARERAISFLRQAQKG